MLSADFARSGEAVRAVDAAGADWIHVDVMDGRFVPNISFGPVVLKAIRRSTSKPLNVHLMIVEPERYFATFANAGADHLLVQAEPGSTTHLHRVLTDIRALGRKAGVVFDPASPPGLIEYVLHLCDIILVMTVNPGFRGQVFLPEMLAKIRSPASSRTFQCSTNQSARTAPSRARPSPAIMRPTPTPVPAVSC